VSATIAVKDRHLSGRICDSDASWRRTGLVRRECAKNTCVNVSAPPLDVYLQKSGGQIEGDPIVSPPLSFPYFPSLPLAVGPLNPALSAGPGADLQPKLNLVHYCFKM